jgi:hypothetical protein
MIKNDSNLIRQAQRAEGSKGKREGPFGLEVVKSMLEKKIKGRIITIASTNSIQPSTGISAY